MFRKYLVKPAQGDFNFIQNLYFVIRKNQVCEECLGAKLRKNNVSNKLYFKFTIFTCECLGPKGLSRLKRSKKKTSKKILAKTNFILPTLYEKDQLEPISP